MVLYGVLFRASFLRVLFGSCVLVCLLVYNSLNCVCAFVVCACSVIPD